MSKKVTEVAGKVAVAALNPTAFLIEQIVDATSSGVSKAEKISDQELAEIQLEARRQELQMRMAEAQAKVAQELAIAKRIEDAEDVEIEEFYEYSGEGGLRAGFAVDSVALSADAAARRVSKRVYRFTKKKE